MSEAQGEVIAETNDVPVIENEAEQVEAVAENEETVQEPVEIDYKAEYEKSQAATEAMQKKIDRQRAASSQNNAKIQELSNKLAELQKVEAPKEPSIDDFETHDEYVNALVEFRAETAVKEKEASMLAKQQQDAIEQKAAEQRKAFDAAEAQYKLDNPDYMRAKTELADHLQVNSIPMHMQNAIYDAAELAGNVPAVIDYFGKDGGANLQEFDRILSLSPIEAAFEVFKISQGFSSDAKPKTKETKPLPKPLSKTEGTSKGKKTLNDLSQNEFRKWISG